MLLTLLFFPFLESKHIVRNLRIRKVSHIVIHLTNIGCELCVLGPRLGSGHRPQGRPACSSCSRSSAAGPGGSRSWAITLSVRGAVGGEGRGAPSLASSRLWGARESLVVEATFTTSFERHVEFHLFVRLSFTCLPRTF